MAQDAGGSDLVVEIEPFSSAFFAGELFQAKVTLTNPRRPLGQRSAGSPRGWTRGHYAGGSVDRGSLMPTDDTTAGPSTNLYSAQELDGKGESARPRNRLKQIGPKVDLAAKGNQPEETSSQGGRTPASLGSAATPAGLRDWRRSGPVSRARSVDLLDGTVSPQEMVWNLTQQEGQIQSPIPSKHPHARKVSVTSVPPSPTASRVSFHHESSSPRPSLSTINENIHGRVEDASTRMSTTSLPTDVSNRRRPQYSHSRQPSYLNAYGAEFLGIGLANSLQPKQPEPSRIVTILWAHARFRGHFTPSSAHIPPDPLLPLRSLLLHQPLGSGSLLPTDRPALSSRWSLSFGSGTIGHEQNPSLTGSLVGLARGLVSGGQAGTLQDERRKVWAAKSLPVLETLRSLIGVDIQLKPGESKSYKYSIRLPQNLPPSFRGQALRFGYELEVSIDIAVPASGGKQRVKEFRVPIKVWPQVAYKQSNVANYDILSPIMQRLEEGRIEEDGKPSKAAAPTIEDLSSPKGNVRAELADYIRALEHSSVDAIEGPQQGDNRVQPPEQGSGSLRTGKASNAQDPMVGGGREMVEILSRTAQKSTLEIGHNGSDIAQVTLLKSTFRAGESISGVVHFVDSKAFQVLKFSAKLQSKETLPDLLIPESPATGLPVEPKLERIHSEHAIAVTASLARATFTLDVPPDVTPSFEVNAANSDRAGGLHWQLRMAFLIGYREATKGAPGRDLDGDNTAATSNKTERLEVYRSAPALLARNGADLVPGPPGRSMDSPHSRTETLDCVVPLRIIPGISNTRPSPSVFGA